jgi:hypothetical protein
VLLEGNDLAFDIKAVASPDAGSDLTRDGPDVTAESSTHGLREPMHFYGRQYIQVVGIGVGQLS